MTEVNRNDGKNYKNAKKLLFENSRLSVINYDDDKQIKLEYTKLESIVLLGFEIANSFNTFKNSCIVI